MHILFFVKNDVIILTLTTLDEVDSFKFQIINYLHLHFLINLLYIYLIYLMWSAFNK